jgi:hypothetical protein
VCLSLSHAVVLTPVDAARRTPSYLIQPGQRVGALRIGDTRQQAIARLGSPSEEYSYSSCSRSEMHWVNPSPSGIFAYLRDGRVFQIEVGSTRFRTSAGLGSGSSPRALRRAHKAMDAYWLVHSGGDIVGGRDLIYWVDRQTGIAFELAWDPNTNRRSVLRTCVFAPGATFAPQGCVVPPHEWRSLPQNTEHIPFESP